jgi:hypothetical protein
MSFPNIIAAQYGASRRGPAVFLTLEGVGTVEITLRELLQPRRFVRAVYKQTGRVLEAPPKGDWHNWLNACVARARRPERIRSSAAVKSRGGHGR